MINRVELKENAKHLFKKAYWKSVGAGAIFGLASYAMSKAYYYTGSNFGIHNAPHPSLLFYFSILVGIVAFILFSAVEVGLNNFFLKNNAMADDQSPSMKELLVGFKGNLKNVALVLFLRNLKLLLWSLCLVIPGIVKGYEYRMVAYILAEDPNTTAKEAFALSKQMMSGHKWDAFKLDLSFLGWHLLSILTFGLLEIFYVAPYKHTTNAGLYRELKPCVAL